MANLKKELITEVVRFCNRDLVPDSSYDIVEEYPSVWFENYFSFLCDDKLQKKLGEAFYQARFMYKLMCALRLPLNKQSGIVKFQIIQYASICEAVLDTAITHFFKTESENEFSIVEFKKDNNALCSNVKLIRKNETLVICKEKKKKGLLKRTRVDFKTSFAVKYGLLSGDLKNRLDVLYDQRNNIHILKATETNYRPKLKEAKESFILMEEIVEYIKQYYVSHSEPND